MKYEVIRIRDNEVVGITKDVETATMIMKMNKEACIINYKG